MASPSGAVATPGLAASAPAPAGSPAEGGAAGGSARPDDRRAERLRRVTAILKEDPGDVTLVRQVLRAAAEAAMRCDEWWEPPRKKAVASLCKEVHDGAAAAPAHKRRRLAEDDPDAAEKRKHRRKDAGGAAGSSGAAARAAGDGSSAALVAARAAGDGSSAALVAARAAAAAEAARKEAAVLPRRESGEQQQRASVLLEDAQRAALETVSANAAAAHANAMKPGGAAEQAARAAGYDRARLEAALAHLRDAAPVIMCFKTEKSLAAIMADDRYRNLFEVGTGNGCLDVARRNTWELNSFPAYAKELRAGRRPKYGTVNLCGDCGAIGVVATYGNAYFTLKREVRSRITITAGDSSAPRAIGTLVHAGHVVAAMDSATLKGFLSAAGTAKGMKHAGTMYMEAQIHGQVMLSRDMEDLVLMPSALATAEPPAKAACAKYGLNFISLRED